MESTKATGAHSREPDDGYSAPPAKRCSDAEWAEGERRAIASGRIPGPEGRDRYKGVKLTPIPAGVTDLAALTASRTERDDGR